MAFWDDFGKKSNRRNYECNVSGKGRVGYYKIKFNGSRRRKANQRHLFLKLDRLM